MCSAFRLAYLFEVVRSYAWDLLNAPPEQVARLFWSRQSFRPPIPLQQPTRKLEHLLLVLLTPGAVPLAVGPEAQQGAPEAGDVGVHVYLVSRGGGPLRFKLSAQSKLYLHRYR